MQNVLISGGTGLIGSKLTDLLIANNYEVRILSRTRDLSGQIKKYHWDLETGEIDKEAFQDLDFIIHLAGAGVADSRWTDSRKKEIIESRTKSGELLHKTVQELGIDLKAFISASGTGYYGAKTTDHIHTEEEKRGSDFLAKVCCEWETEAMKFKAKDTRTVVLRTGVVLAKDGGALKKMSTPVKFFLGSALGTGKQYMPWIHIDDLCKMYLASLKNSSLDGIYNAVSLEHQSNKSFTKLLCKTLNRPFIPIPVPAFMLKLMLGEMSSILLEGSRVCSRKFKEAGFEFEFEKLEEALSSLAK